MRVFVPKDEEEFVREKRRAAHHEQAEATDGAEDCGILPAQFPLLLAARECRNENIREQIVDYDKNHRQPAKRADFRDRAGLAGEETDQENRDLSLKTKKDRVGCLIPNETVNGAAIVRIFTRVEVDNTGGISTQHEILQRNRDGADSDGHGGIKKDEHDRDEKKKPGERPGEIDELNLASRPTADAERRKVRRRKTAASNRKAE